MPGMLKHGATHLAIATDHVIESFRNELWPGYKTGDGILALVGDAAVFRSVVATDCGSGCRGFKSRKLEFAVG